MKWKSDWWISIASFAVFLALVAAGVGIYFISQNNGGDELTNASSQE